jgi:hypothetical protein
VTDVTRYGSGRTIKIKIISAKGAKKSAKNAKKGYDNVGGDPSVVFAGAQPIEEHLLNRLVVGHQDMANGVAADEMAHLFR